MIGLAVGAVTELRTVPLTGKVNDVLAVTVNVVVKAPEVVKLPPMVNVLPVLATPVPPLAPTNIPASVIAPVVAVAGVNPVELPENDKTPVLAIVTAVDPLYEVPESQ